MTDVFNPTKKNKQTAPVFSLDDIISAPNVVQAGAVTVDMLNAIEQQTLGTTLQGLEERSNLIVQTTEAAKATFAKQQEERKKLEAAQSQRARIQQIPPLISRILGIFDPNFDWNAQNEQVRASKQAIAAAGIDLDNYQTMAQLQESVIKSQIEMANTTSDILSGQVSRAFDLRKLISSEQDAAQARQYRANEEARQQAAFGMETMKFEQQQMAFEIGGMTDDEISAKLADPNTPNKGYIQQEKANRDITRVNLDNAFQANAQGDLDFAAKYRMRVLSSESADTLKSLAEKADASGGTVTMQSNNGPVSFTSNEIKQAAAQAAGVETEARKATTELLTSQLLSNYNYEDANQKVGKFSTVMGSSFGVPSLVRLQTEAGIKIQAAIASDDPISAANFAADYNKAVDAEIESIINKLPDGQKPFIREQLNNLPTSQTSAADYLGNAALNKNALSHPIDQFYSPIVAKINKDLGGAGFNIDENDPNAIMSLFASSGNQRKLPQLVQQAVDSLIDDNIDPQTGEMLTPGLRTMFEGERDLYAYELAFNDLRSKAPWLQGISTLRQFSDPVNPSSFDVNTFLVNLRDKYNIDIEKGIVNINNPQSRPYDQIFLDYMISQGFQQRVFSYWNDGLTATGRAVSTLITGDDPLINYYQNIAGTQAGFQKYYDTIKQQQKDIKKNEIPESAYRSTKMFLD
jgi:hypothetical protein